MAVFIQTEEIQQMAQLGVRDFFRVEWAENLGEAIWTEVLEEAVVQAGVVETEA